MAKLSKPVIFGLSSVAVLFVVIVAFLIPFGGRTVLARSLDTLGQHKAALGTDRQRARPLACRPRRGEVLPGFHRLRLVF